MNQPDRYARFVLPDGVSAVEYAKDTKLSNAATFTIRLEDHTVGNLLRQQLHTDPKIVFAGYRIPHPLDPLMQVRVQTTQESSPIDAMLNATRDLKAEVEAIKAQLSQAAPRDDRFVQQPLHLQQQQQQQFMAPGGYDVAAGGYGGYQQQQQQPPPPAGGYAPGGYQQAPPGGGGYGY